MLSFYCYIPRHRPYMGFLDDDEFRRARSIGIAIRHESSIEMHNFIICGDRRPPIFDMLYVKYAFSSSECVLCSIYSEADTPLFGER